MTAQGIFSALKEPFNKNIIISLRSVLVTSLVLYFMFWTNFDLKSMICISIQGEGKIRRVTTIIFGSPSAKNFADFPQWRCKLLTGWSDDSETIVAQCHPKTQGHGHRWAGPQSRLMISWSPKYKIARSPKYDRPSCPTKILDIVTPGFSPFHRLSSLKKTIIL